jgi:hypothetical protein
MTLLTREFLADIGIDMPDNHYRSLVEHFDATLYDRIFTEIASELSPEQAEQLVTIQARPDEEIQQWLIANVPELQQIVSDEVDILLGEVAESAESLEE